MACCSICSRLRAHCWPTPAKQNKKDRAGLQRCHARRTQVFALLSCADKRFAPVAARWDRESRIPAKQPHTKARATKITVKPLRCACLRTQAHGTDDIQGTAWSGGQRCPSCQAMPCPTGKWNAIGTAAKRLKIKEPQKSASRHAWGAPSPAASACIAACGQCGCCAFTRMLSHRKVLPAVIVVVKAV